MAVSRPSRRDGRSARRTRVRNWLPSDRYDLILAVIPLVFFVAYVVHVALGVSVAATLLPASVVGVGLLVDALYLNPPSASGGS